MLIIKNDCQKLKNNNNKELINIDLWSLNILVEQKL